jgi:hypothetical protein
MFIFVDAAAKHVLVEVPGGVDGSPDNPYAFQKLGHRSSWEDCAVTESRAVGALERAGVLLEAHDILVLPVPLALLERLRRKAARS